MCVMKRKSYVCVAAVVLAVSAWGLAADGPEPATVESGAISFEAATNVPGIGVKGSSSSFAAQAFVAHEGNELIVEQLHVVLQVKSLATGMKVRDEHMRKYIFVRSDGQMPDVEFKADKTTCARTAGDDFTCQAAGQLSIR